MFILGVTGSFGSGKTTVARLFKAKGAQILDADKIAHQLMAPKGACFRPIVRRFGKDILWQGRVDRKKIAQLVFCDSKALRDLTAIIHPKVAFHLEQEIRRYRKAAKVRVVVLDVPLLIEAGLHQRCDGILVVKANRALQIKRIKQRSGLQSQEITRRIKAQMPINQKIAQAHYVIDNRGNFNQTQKQVEAVWKKILKRK